MDADRENTHVWLTVGELRHLLNTYEMDGENCRLYVRDGERRVGIHRASVEIRTDGTSALIFDTPRL